MRALRAPFPAGRPGARDEGGMSLVEVVAAVAIFSIVSTTLAVSFDSWLKNTRITQDRSEAMAEGRLGMAQMIRSLRPAVALQSGTTALHSAGPFSVTFRELTSTSQASGRSIFVTFERTAQRTILETRRLGTATGQILVGPKVIARYVSNPTSPPTAVPVFRYFSNPNTELASSRAGQPLTSQELASVALVRITLVMDKDPSSSIGQTVFTDTAYIRSRGF